MKNNIKRIVVVCRASHGGAYVYSMKFLDIFLKYFNNRYKITYVGPLLDKKFNSQLNYIPTLKINIPLLADILFFFYFPILFIRNFDKKDTLIISHCRVFSMPGFRLWSVYHSLHFQQLFLPFRSLFLKIIYFIYHLFYSIFDFENFFISEKNFFINPYLNKYKFIPNNFYIPNFVNTDIFFPQLTKEKKDFFHILFVGRNDYAKGLGNALNAILSYKDEFELLTKKPIFLTVVSPSLPVDIKVDRHINFLENNDMVNIYNNSDIFINPSLFENVSTVLLEAMSSGTVVLTKKVGYLSSIIPFQDYQTYSGDEDFVKTLLQICSSDRKLLKIIGRDNRNFVLNLFGIKSMYEFFSQIKNQI